ncbi:hypothetical protein ACQEU3_13065 [Spirillospora sp. CA-253888]
MCETFDCKPEVVKAELRAEFPGWSIIHTDRGRWWATRGPLPRDQANRIADVEADTPEQLRARLQAVTGAGDAWQLAAHLRKGDARP